MNIATLAVKNVLPQQAAHVLPSLGVAVAIVAVHAAAHRGAVVDRRRRARGARTASPPATRSRFIMPLPKRYVEDIARCRASRGVTESRVPGPTGSAARTRTTPNDFFATIAVEPEVVPRGLRRDRSSTRSRRRPGSRTGAARSSATSWPRSSAGRWATRSPCRARSTPATGSSTSPASTRPSGAPSIDSTLWFHWDYLNESLRSAGRRTRSAGSWRASTTRAVGARCRGRSTSMFDERDTQTITMSEKALNQSFLGFFSAILDRHRRGDLRHPGHHGAHPGQHDRHGRARTDAEYGVPARHRVPPAAPGRLRHRRGAHHRARWAAFSGSALSWLFVNRAAGAVHRGEHGRVPPVLLPHRAGRAWDSDLPSWRRWWRQSCPPTGPQAEGDRCAAHGRSEAAMIPLRYNVRSLLVRRDDHARHRCSASRWSCSCSAAAMMLERTASNRRCRCRDRPTTPSSCARARTPRSRAASRPTRSASSWRRPGSRRTAGGSRSASARSSS